MGKFGFPLFSPFPSLKSMRIYEVQKVGGCSLFFFPSFWNLFFLFPAVSLLQIESIKIVHIYILLLLLFFFSLSSLFSFPPPPDFPYFACLMHGRIRGGNGGSPFLLSSLTSPWVRGAENVVIFPLPFLSFFSYSSFLACPG